MRVPLVLAFFVILVLAACACWGGIPHLIHYQGMLTDDAGNPLNTPQSLTFRIYNVESGGSSKWGETQNDIPLSNGLFSVLLGSVHPIDLSFDEDYWLEIEVSVYDTLLPRMKLASVGYAYRAEWADTADHCLTAHTADSALWSDTSDHSIKADTASYAIEALTAESDGDWTISGDSLYRLSGNVGIGTTSPDQKLTLPWGSYLGWEYSSGNSVVSHRIGKSSDGAGPLEFVTTHNPGLTGKIFSFKRSEASEIFTVLYNGNVGIGTTSPAAGLEVIGTGIADHLRLTNTDSPGPALYLNAANRDWVIWGTCPGADAGDQRLVFRDYTAAENRMVIDSAGRVGIGTDEPWSKLHIHEPGGTGPTYAQFTNPNTYTQPTDGFFVGINSSGNAFISNNEDKSLTIQTSGTDRMHITSAGKVGIGTTTPDKILHIGGGGQTPFQTADGLYVNPNAASVAISAEDITGVEGGIMAHNNGNVYIGAWSNHSVMFRTDNLDRGIIDASGNFGIGTTSPQGALDVSSTTGAFIVPRMTTAQRNALTAVNGMIIYNTTTNKFNFYENGAWYAKTNE